MEADSRQRILIVDDEPAVRLALEMALAETPHLVESVDSAERALALIEQRPFDLLIVDKNLPGLNGVELIRRVRQTHEDVWSAMITGYPSADSAMEMLHLGVRGYLEKPFEDIYEVVRRIDYILELRRNRGRPTGAADRMRDAVQKLPSPRSLRIVVLSPFADERTWLAQRTGTGLDFAVAAASAEDALAVARAQPPDLMVCDASLRNPDIFGVMREARAVAPELSFAVVCDPPSLKMLTELIEARTAAVIPRPLSEGTYRARIDTLLQRLRMTPPPSKVPAAAHP